MNNADKPAYPISDSTCQDAFDMAYGTMPHGLTKRERFAMAAMQGLVSHPKSHSYDGMSLYESTAHDAVQHADALLKALEE